MQLHILILEAECQEVIIEVGRHIVVELLHGGDIADDVADYHEVHLVDAPDYWQQLAAPHQLEGEVGVRVVQVD